MEERNANLEREVKRFEERQEKEAKVNTCAIHAVRLR